MKLTNKQAKWVKAAGIRAIKTVAQAALGAIGASTMFGNVNWRVVVSTAVLSGICSILTSVAGLPEIKEDEPNE